MALITKRLKELQNNSHRDNSTLECIQYIYIYISNRFKSTEHESCAGHDDRKESE